MLAAVLLTTVWFRGYAIVDGVILRSAVDCNCLETSRGRLSWTRVTDETKFLNHAMWDRLEYFSDRNDTRHYPKKTINVGRVETYFGELPVVRGLHRCHDEAHWQFLGAEFAQGEWWNYGGPWDADPLQRDDNRFCKLDIPHWMAVLPLTLLSAYLILWKPRKRTEPDHA